MDAFQCLPLNRIYLGTWLCLFISSIGPTATAEQVPNNKPLIVTAKLAVPYVMEKFTVAPTDETVKRNDRYEGFLIDLLDRLARHANFTYEIHPVHDNQYGIIWQAADPSITGSGTWTGLIGELIRQEADLALGATMNTENRMAVVDFTEPYLDVKLTIVTRKPLHPDQPVPFSSFEELANQTHIQYGVIAGGSTYAFFQQSTVEPYKTIGTYLNTHPQSLAEDFEEAINRVRSSNGSYVFIMEKPAAEFVTARPPCEITCVGEASLTDGEGYGIALPKNSPWTARLSSLIKQWKSNGIIRELYNKWWYANAWMGTCRK